MSTQIVIGASAPDPFRLLDEAKDAVVAAVKKEIAEQDAGFPEYHPALNALEQYANATSGYFNECDYNEERVWEWDLETVLGVLRKEACWQRLSDEFGGRTEEYWEAIYAMARLKRYLDYVLDWERPRTPPLREIIRQVGPGDAA